MARPKGTLNRKTILKMRKALDEEDKKNPPAPPSPIVIHAVEEVPRPAPAPEPTGEYRPYTDVVVPDAYTWNGEPMELPIQGLARLTRDEGRGMMGTTGELDPVYDKYLHTLDLDELKFALSLQPNSLKVVQFLSDLVNPIKADTNITTLAKQRGIGQTEMMEIWRSYKLSHALGVYIDAAPNLAGHVAKDAESIKICCPRCDGAGVILVTRRDNEQAWIDCPTCESTGAVRRPGDKASRDLVFHAIGMVKSGGSGNVTVNVQQNAQGVESVIDELDRITPVIDLPPALPEDDD